MGLRITTWNVNGIRNPFGYQPWRDRRTFAAMFEILEADIVVMQETKIQRKDLRDDMVLVPGWDVYFSLPKHKKGYSGVVIYTRNSVCAPIKAEEGITGILTAPNSSTSFFDLPEEERIGGYQTAEQLEGLLDPVMLDSEGRCVILEFPAFVLIGVYNPANRDETRDEFRIGFLTALDARVRNLVAMGKRVFLTGDLNIIRAEIDTANAEEQLRKHGMTGEEYISTPARRMLNQLLEDGKVIGQRDEGREEPVMWDICRAFHPGRRGMFTCWETKVNARPGNFGSRIDYVICSLNWKEWFCASDIQEGLLGSDHCPVYAVIKDKVEIDGQSVDIRDVVNPPGMFRDGIRTRGWCSKDLLPMSAKLIPEFDRRRNIRDMFTKMPSLPLAESSADVKGMDEDEGSSDRLLPSLFDSNDTRLRPDNDDVQAEAPSASSLPISTLPSSQPTLSPAPGPSMSPAKRPIESPTRSRSFKRSKSGSTKPASTNGATALPKGQSSLKGFFKPKAQPQDPSLCQDSAIPAANICREVIDSGGEAQAVPSIPETDLIVNGIPSRMTETTEVATTVNEKGLEEPTQMLHNRPLDVEEPKDVIDPIVAKESWSKLLSKRVVPRCEHNEPCISFLTKKAGINCGRSFYMCPRPLGPSGAKEKNTQWRCGTFIWSSDWTGDGT